MFEQDPALRPAGSRSTPAGSDRRIEARRCTELRQRSCELINRIESYGCVVKDLDLGLLDFPACGTAARSILCWKIGEAPIEHWHGTDETFVDRKDL